MANFDAGLIVVSLSWEDLKAIVTTKCLFLQYDETPKKYHVFCVDGPIVYETSILKAVQNIVGLDTEAEEAKLTDFVDNFKDLSNSRLSEPAQVDKARLVAIVGREGAETIWSTHNFCDPTSWYCNSERLSEELVDSGDGLTFTASPGVWVDMIHGKIFDEDGMREEVEHAYNVVVVANGITQSQHDPYNGVDGTFVVNYASGSITFLESMSGQTVTAEFSRPLDATWVLKPEPEKALDIEQAKIQFTEDMIMNSGVRFDVFGLVDVFAPQYLDTNGGPYPSGTLIPISSQVYNSISQIVDEAIETKHPIPAFGGEERGIASAVHGLVFRYSTIRRLWSKYGMELRISLTKNQQFGGTRATGTFYCVSRLESSIL